MNIVQSPCTPLLHPFCGGTFASLIHLLNIEVSEISLRGASEIARELILLFERTGSNMTDNVKELLKEHLEMVSEQRLHVLAVMVCQVLWTRFEMAGTCHDLSREFMSMKHKEYKDQFQKNICMADIKLNYSDVMSGETSKNMKESKSRKVCFARDYVNAATRNPDVGVYLMQGLQSLRESPMPELVKLKNSWVRVYCSVQKEHLEDLVKGLNVRSVLEYCCELIFTETMKEQHLH